MAAILIADIEGTSKHIFMPRPPAVRYLDDKGDPLPEHEFDVVLNNIFEDDVVPFEWQASDEQDQQDP